MKITQKYHCDYFETLVLSGGGSRGIAYVGCIKILVAFDILTYIRNYVGCSIGSLIVTLLCCGYTFNELETLMLDFDYIKLQDLDFINFFVQFGIDSGNKLELFIDKLIEKKTKIKNCTFAQLYTFNSKNLVINTTCLSTQSILYCCHSTTPDLIISKACRMSCSIPFLYTPVKYNNQLYIDGAVMDNFPIYYLKNTKTLGIQLTYDNNTTLNENVFINYCNNIFECINKKIIIEDNPYLVTITINCPLGFHSMTLDNVSKLRIFDTGYNQTLKVLKNFYNKYRFYCLYSDIVCSITNFLYIFNKYKNNIF